MAQKQRRRRPIRARPAERRDGDLEMLLFQSEKEEPAESAAVRDADASFARHRDALRSALGISG